MVESICISTPLLVCGVATWVGVPTTVIKRVAVISAMPLIITEYPQFFTATNLEWKNLLQVDKYKDIVIDSMRFIVKDKRVIIYGFVIMQNHIHIIWQMQAGVKRENVQRDFLKHTAQKMQEDMIRNKSKDLSEYLVNAKNRKYPRLTGRAGILGTEFFVS